MSTYNLMPFMPPPLSGNFKGFHQVREVLSKILYGQVAWVAEAFFVVQGGGWRLNLPEVKTDVDL